MNQPWKILSLGLSTAAARFVHTHHSTLPRCMQHILDTHTSTVAGSSVCTLDLVMGKICNTTCHNLL
ncbi:hypothetical protein M3J09_010038 [Ascochyta lentis]